MAIKQFSKKMRNVIDFSLVIIKIAIGFFVKKP